MCRRNQTHTYLLDGKAMKKALTALAAGVPLVAAAVYLPTASAVDTRDSATTAVCAAPSVRAPAGTDLPTTPPDPRRAEPR